jgi:hypothetical protein
MVFSPSISFLFFPHPRPFSYSPLTAESLNSLELLYGEAVTRTDIDGIEAEKKRIEFLQKIAQGKKNLHLNSSTSAGKGSVNSHCLYSLPLTPFTVHSNIPAYPAISGQHSSSLLSSGYDMILIIISTTLSPLLSSLPVPSLLSSLPSPFANSFPLLPLTNPPRTLSLTHTFTLSHYQTYTFTHTGKRVYT